MGIVRKQSFLSSIFMYAGAVIGALNTMILFPKFFKPEDYGLYTVFIDCAMVFSGLITFGAMNTFIKFYPTYQSHLKPKENDLPFWVVLFTFIGSVLFVLACLLYPELIERKFGHNSKLFVQNFNLVIPLALSFAAFLVLEAFCWMIRKTVVSNFVREVMFRLFMLVCIIAYIFHWITWRQFFFLFSFMYIPGVIILLWTIAKDGNIKIIPKISRVTKRLHKKILVFSTFHFSGILINILPKAMDGIMLASITGLSSAAVYNMSLNFLTMVDIPQRSMTGIASALISEAWKNKDRKKIKEIYHKTSLNLLVVGILIFGIFYSNMDNMVRFVGPSYALIKQVFLIGGIAKLVDMGMGMNQAILGYSKYWRLDFFTSTIALFLTIAINYWCIRQWGLMGAAIGNALCLIGFNLIRFAYNWKLFKLQPFTKNTVYTVLVGAGALIPTLLLPYLGNMFLDAFVRAGLFVGLYALGILYFNISSDFSDMYRMFVMRLKTKK